MDLSLADIDAAKEAIARNRDFVVGVKARLTRGVAADDVEVMRRAQDVATSFSLPLMIHMGQTASPLPTLLSQLKRGDIVTHMFAPPPNSIIDDDDHILPEVLAARRRGVWFDVANGRTGHLRWDTFDRIIQAGFWPDTISTDGNTTSRNAESVIDFPNVMSKFLNFGMTIEQVVARATVNASRLFPLFHDRGTLNVGAPADVAVLHQREGTFEFVDNYGNTRTGRHRLFPERDRARRQAGSARVANRNPSRRISPRDLKAGSSPVGDASPASDVNRGGATMVAGLQISRSRATREQEQSSSSSSQATPSSSRTCRWPRRQLPSVAREKRRAEAVGR